MVNSKKKILFKVISSIIVVILALLLFFNLYNIVGRLVFKETLPKFFGYSEAVVESGSMSPEIETYDFIINSKMDNYKVGDIITYEKNGLVTHRIVEITDDGFITKGDHNNTADREAVEIGQIQGKVVLVIPKIGYAIDFLKTPYGIVIIIALAAILVKMPAIIEKIRNKKGGREYETK